jgi:hypothetical protein
LTVAAQNAQTQAAQSAVPPATNTTLPTQTEAVVPSPTPILPTATNTAVVLEFDIKWTIVNTGTKTMRAGLDVKYNSGTKLTSTTFVELPELEPGEEATVDFDAVAPEKEGTYIMTFLVEGGLCYPYTAIIVEKP